MTVCRDYYAPITQGESVVVDDTNSNDSITEYVVLLPSKAENSRNLYLVVDTEWKERISRGNKVSYELPKVDNVVY